MIRFHLLVLSVVITGPAQASLPMYGATPPPRTWAVPSADETYIFVMRGETAEESDHPYVSEEDRARASALWHRYPRSGLYRQATGELVWATNERMELRSNYQEHEVRVSDCGRYVVWLAHSPHGPRKYPPRKGGGFWSFGNRIFCTSSGPSGDLSESKDGLGIRLMAGGQTVGGYTPLSLKIDPGAFDNELAYGYRPWIAAVEVADGRLRLDLLDDQKLTFDLDSGELVRRESLGAPLWPVVAVVGGIMLLLTAAAVLLRKPVRSQPPRATGYNSGNP